MTHNGPRAAPFKVEHLVAQKVDTFGLCNRALALGRHSGEIAVAENKQPYRFRTRDLGPQLWRPAPGGVAWATCLDRDELHK